MRIGEHNSLILDFNIEHRIPQSRNFLNYLENLTHPLMVTSFLRVQYAVTLCYSSLFGMSNKEYTVITVNKL